MKNNANMTASAEMAELHSTSKFDPATFGNKAWGLWAAARAGYPVPAGFALSPGFDDNAKLSQALQSYSPPFAVRSSSTSEDSATQAYPGIFETVLGPSTLDEVVRAIADVARSSSSPDVESYAGRPIQIEMGVIVQELVPASTAGVAFSRDPTTGEPTTIVEAAKGLGVAVVDGHVVPESWSFDRTGLLLEHLPGKQRIQYTYDPATRAVVATEPLDTGRALTNSVSDSVAAGVARMSVELEDHFAYPVDIEWAVDDHGDLFLLQVRPITTIRTEGAL